MPRWTSPNTLKLNSDNEFLLDYNESFTSLVVCAYGWESYVVCAFNEISIGTTLRWVINCDVVESVHKRHKAFHLILKKIITADFMTHTVDWVMLFLSANG